jgi:phosphoribosylanthranilate isomerase
MLNTAANVNRKLKPGLIRIFFHVLTQNPSTPIFMIVQIYEIQDPFEAEKLVEIGVDRIGSVLISETDWKVPGVRDTIQWVRSSLAKSSLIPLYNTLDSVLHSLDFYQPDIVHFCESLADEKDGWGYCRRLIQLQKDIKKRFPQIEIMRSIPIAQSGKNESVPTLELSRWFEPVSDFFLTDTLLTNESGTHVDFQPVRGFVGITGQRCSWKTAADLVESCRIPVILAGGVSPDNVAEGIRRVRPAGVDSCTRTNALDKKGVPIRFRKDLQKVKQLVAAVREAENTLK